MNKNDRKQLARAIGFLEEAKAIIDELAPAERDKYDNMSESLQSGERGEAIGQAADALESAQSSIDEALEYLGNVES